MTELDRMQIVENMFPEWREHLNDGKVIDYILEGLCCREIVLNRCSRPGCNNVARSGLKTCLPCAAKAAHYMQNYKRHKTANRERVETCRELEGTSIHPHTPENKPQIGDLKG